MFEQLDESYLINTAEEEKLIEVAAKEKQIIRTLKMFRNVVTRLGGMAGIPEEIRGNLELVRNLRRAGTVVDKKKVDIKKLTALMSAPSECSVF